MGPRARRFSPGERPREVLRRYARKGQRIQLDVVSDSTPKVSRTLWRVIPGHLLGLSHHSAAVPGDLLFFLCWDNFNLVCSEAEKFEAVCSCGTNVIAVLSDAASVYEKVHIAKKRNVCTNYLAYRSGKDIQRKRGMRIVGAGPVFQRLHI